MRSEPNHTTASAQEESEQRELVARIADTPRFRSAPRIRDFLLHICSLALSGRVGEITESHIGTDVFGRQPGYDTGSDNIVRVTARQLRVKLLEYFESEGRDESWRVEIPKGSYVPTFRRLQPAVEGAAAAAHNPWRVAALVLAAAALVSAATAAWQWRRAAQPTTRDPAERSIMDLVIRPEQRTIIVLADAGLVYVQQYSGRVLSIEEYANRNFGGLEETSAELRPLLSALTQSQLTSVADIGLVARVLRSSGGLAGNIEVRHARNITARSLREDNVVLLGGPRSNPWVRLFENRLNFRFAFSPKDAAATMINNQPRPGELPAYRPGDGKDYALVAVLPSNSANRNILLIAGSNMEATEAAAEFATRPGLTGLAETLKIPALSGNASFEVLLETSSAAGAAKDARPIASRIYRH